MAAGTGCIPALPAGDLRGWGGSVGENPSQIPPETRREVSAPRPRGSKLQEQRSGPRGNAWPDGDSSWISGSLEVTPKLSKQTLSHIWGSRGTICHCIGTRGKGRGKQGLGRALGVVLRPGSSHRDTAGAPQESHTDTSFHSAKTLHQPPGNGTDSTRRGEMGGQCVRHPISFPSSVLPSQ